jgi:hypothetical protein
MWKTQRIGWAVMLLILMATFFGVFGGGPLSRVSATDPSGALTVEYQRITRHLAPGELLISARTMAPDADTLRVWMDLQLSESLNPVDVTPQPARVETSADRVTYTFLVSKGANRAEILFEIAPRKTWLRRGRLGLTNGGVLQLTQFIWP